MSAPTPDALFAVALFPADGGFGVRDLRVRVDVLFGTCPADSIGARVREVSATGAPFGEPHIVAIQRLVFCSINPATGKLRASATELTEKRDAYARALEIQREATHRANLANLFPAPPPRRKPSLPVGWAAEHEAAQEASQPEHAHA